MGRGADTDSAQAHLRAHPLMSRRRGDSGRSPFQSDEVVRTTLKTQLRHDRPSAIAAGIADLISKVSRVRAPDAPVLLELREAFIAHARAREEALLAAQRHSPRFRFESAAAELLRLVAHAEQALEGHDSLPEELHNSLTLISLRELRLIRDEMSALRGIGDPSADVSFEIERAKGTLTAIHAAISPHYIYDRARNELDHAIYFIWDAVQLAFNGGLHGNEWHGDAEQAFRDGLDALAHAIDELEATAAPDDD
jgi:hypothetical protein